MRFVAARGELLSQRLRSAVNETFEQKPTMVRYADDRLILCKPGQGAGLQTRLKWWLEARK